MKFTEVKGDLFSAPQGTYLAHCISGDYTLGAGIAKKFVEIYNMRFKLHKNYPLPGINIGKALLVDNVFNLVTKHRYFEKPTYESLEDTLYNMKEIAIEKDITKISMPKIGCGLDKLDWESVKELIEEVFEDTDIEIVIYSLN